MDGDAGNGTCVCDVSIVSWLSVCFLVINDVNVLTVAFYLCHMFGVFLFSLYVGRRMQHVVRCELMLWLFMSCSLKPSLHRRDSQALLVTNVTNLTFMEKNVIKVYSSPCWHLPGKHFRNLKKVWMNILQLFHSAVCVFGLQSVTVKMAHATMVQTVMGSVYVNPLTAGKVVTKVRCQN